jgi:hypothetical protein
MLVDMWEEFQEEITFYQLSFTITVVIGLATIYLCT